MKQIRLCDWLLQGRRWLLMLPALALSGVLLALPSAPAAILLAAPALMMAAMLPTYALRLRRSFGSAYTRPPRPQDALGQTVLIDAELMDGGVTLRCAAQPFDAAERLTLRLGSGALLLGAAMTLTAGELPAADAAALLDAAAQMGIKPDLMQQRSPVLHRSEDGGVTRVTVRDGSRSRTYLLGSPDALCRACTAIQDRQLRPLTDADRARFLSCAAKAAEDARVYAFGTCGDGGETVLLGFAALGQAVRPEAYEGVRSLRAMGLTVMLRPDEAGTADLYALHRLLGLEPRHAQPDLYLSAARIHESPACLTIRHTPGESPERPVAWLRRAFAAIEWELSLQAALLGTTLLCCMLCAAVPSAVSAALWLAVCPLIRPLQGKRLPLSAALAAAGICLMAGLFLAAVLPASGAPALTCLVLTGMLILARYCGACTTPELALLLAPGAIMAVLTLLMQPAAPLACLFAAVMGALAALPALLKAE